MINPPRRLRTLVASEAGISLIETLVAMLAVTMLAGGVFTAVDAASHASGTSKARAIAAALAQEEQERLRGLRIADIANRSTETTRTVDGVVYTIRSRGTFVDDKAGTTTCAGGASKADYVNIVSEVTWPALQQSKVRPVRVESVIAPPTGSFSPTQGSVLVQARDQAGAAVQGLTIDLNGSAGYRQPSNALGCAMFAYLTPGSYTLTASAPGLVDRNGSDQIGASVSVTAQTTRVVAVEADHAGTAELLFETVRPGATVREPTTAEAVSVAHTSLAAPGYRVFPDGAPSPADDPTAYERITAERLFPFASAYGAYSGACPANDPALYGGIRANLDIRPGARVQATVLEPALDLRVSSGATPLADARVVITATSPGCSQRYVRQLLSDGTLADPGLPYGIYTVCVSAAGRKHVVAAVDNTNPNGVAVTMPNPITGVEGAC